MVTEQVEKWQMPVFKTAAKPYGSVTEQEGTGASIRFTADLGRFVLHHDVSTAPRANLSIEPSPFTRTISSDRRHISAPMQARTLTLWKCLSNPESPAQGESAPKVMQKGSGWVGSK